MKILEKYYNKIIEHDGFAQLCQRQDSQNNSLKAEDFYVGQYVLSLAYNGKFEDALSYSKEFVGSTYENNNPLHVLIYNYMWNLMII